MFDGGRPGFTPQPQQGLSTANAIILGALIIAVPPLGIGLVAFFCIVGLFTGKKGK